MKKINCDVVVVGAGPGGSMAAKTCAKYGLDTVLVERKEYSGDFRIFRCSSPYRGGCLPFCNHFCNTFTFCNTFL